MIYTMGCSATKWYWPTWSDWLQLYVGEPITNWGAKGYGNQLIYTLLLDRRHLITKDDHVYIMWSENDRVAHWYDEEWVNVNKCRDFFPATNGRLWFTKSTPFTGLYRVHPDHQVSISHMIINNFQIILNTQLLLDRIGCKYTMMFVENPWLDVRPVYKPFYKTMWDKCTDLTTADLTRASAILELRPVQSMLSEIDWSKFASAVKIYEPLTYNGLWEYTINQKELVSLSHITDPHPNVLAQHNYLVDVILPQGSDRQGKHHVLAESYARIASTMDIPSFSNVDLIGSPDDILIDKRFIM